MFILGLYLYFADIIIYGTTLKITKAAHISGADSKIQVLHIFNTQDGNDSCWYCGFYILHHFY